MLSSRLRTFDIRLYFIYLIWSIDIFMIVDLTGVAVLSGYWNQILWFARLGFSRWFFHFRWRSFFGGVNEMLILFIMRERPSSLWTSNRTFSWWSHFTILAAAVLRPHLPIMSSSPCKFLFRVKCAFLAYIRSVTLGEDLRTIAIFSWSGCPIIENPAPALLLGFVEMLFDNFIELQFGIVNK